MTTSVNPSDPRVKRTRQLLLQAFIALVEERHNLHSISVQEVAERATVNRATFYDHFEDKYALLQCWMHQKHHQILASQFSASSTLQLSTLRQLIRSVFDLLALFRSYLKPADRQYEPLFENVLQQELYTLLQNVMIQSWSADEVHGRGSWRQSRMYVVHKKHSWRQRWISKQRLNYGQSYHFTPGRKHMRRSTCGRRL